MTVLQELGIFNNSDGIRYCIKFVTIYGIGTAKGIKEEKVK